MNIWARRLPDKSVLELENPALSGRVPDLVLRRYFSFAPFMLVQTSCPFTL